MPAVEAPGSALAAIYPLSIVSPKSHGFLNSQYANEAHKLERQGGQAVLIHPDDARARNLADGADVEVFNERGAFHGEAKVTDDVPPGVVVASLGYWHSLNRDGAVNVVSSSRFGGMGHCPTYSDNLVEVRLAG